MLIIATQDKVLKHLLLNIVTNMKVIQHNALIICLIEKIIVLIL